MTVKALYDYDFPSADRVENFGEDQLVYVHWKGNLFLCSAVAFRAPKAMPFGQFVDAMVKPWASSDPDFDADRIRSWHLFEEELDPAPDKSLADLGIGHKALLVFTT